MLGTELPTLLTIRVLLGAGNRDVAPAADEVGFGNAKPPLEAAPPYPNRDGCLSPFEAAAGAIGSLLGSPVLFFPVMLDSTMEIGLPRFNFEFQVAAPSTDAFSLGLITFDPNPNVVFGGPATVAAFEGRGLCTPRRVGLCTGFCWTGVGGTGGRGAEIDGCPAAVEELPPMFGVDAAR